MHRPMCANSSRMCRSAQLLAWCLVVMPRNRRQIRMCGNRSQLAQASTAAGGNLPEAIYWKQDLFLVPYQWSSAAEPAAAQAVWLFVSKDRGASWQKISEARPHVKAFNYRAEGDGEYWFAVRTFDRYGREWPAGPYQPELRVIVDTQMPQIDELQLPLCGRRLDRIEWRCTDQNLDPNNWTLEAQVDAAGAWQPRAGERFGRRQRRMRMSTWPPKAFTAVRSHGSRPLGIRPVAIRATVFDRAGNSGSYRCEIVPAPGSIATTDQPTFNSESAVGIFAAPPLSQPGPQSTGWMPSSAASTPANTPLPNQPWPADATSHTPFRLSSVADSTPTDDVTVYGNPPGVSPNLCRQRQCQCRCRQ